MVNTTTLTSRKFAAICRTIHPYFRLYPRLAIFQIGGFVRV